MGVDDNPNKATIKQKQKGQSGQQRQQVDKEKASSSGSEQIGGRTLRLRQRTGTPNKGEAGSPASSEGGHSE